ncbi:ImmA/IrrE family metallo-endopeptidase [Sphaerisporangium sp. B11E5]|uniref:ImmA/IrrE family metallo-endopeptidase n=1 Tax=Sphaerisporangium sp. B11E5 TaxID=3153563 RepID=UPI00325F801B
MTIIWERFSGRTDAFAFKMTFMPDPDAGAGATPEESASWGSFQIWTYGQNLSAHVSQGEYVPATHWYLLPLLEWLAENWNPLFHEERLPNRNQDEPAATALIYTRNAPALIGEAETVAWEEEWFEWYQRHALRSARDGGLFPHVVVRRFRDLVEVSWDDEPLAGSPPGYRHSSARGVAYFSPEVVASPLYEVLREAARFLLSLCPESKRLVKLSQQVDELTLPGQHNTRLDWLAGLRALPPLRSRLQGNLPEAEMRSRWEEIVSELRNQGNSEGADAALAVEQSSLVISGSCQAALLFSSTSPTVTRDDVHTLAAILVSQYTKNIVTAALEELSEQTVPDPSLPAWEQGYELAEQVHSQLGDRFAEGWVDVAGVLEELQVTLLSARLHDDNIRACSLVGPHHRPTVIHNEASPYQTATAKRFSMAHELCHLLFDRSRGRRLAIASGPWAPKIIERRANAFAAMFLMPTRLVQAARADSPDPIHDLEGITTFAGRLRVSRHAAIEHLYNLTLMSEFDRDMLLRQVRD